MRGHLPGVAVMDVRDGVDEHEIAQPEIAHDPGGGAEVARIVRADQHHAAAVEGHEEIVNGLPAWRRQSYSVDVFMKFTTLIPLRLNDGNEVPPEQLGRILDALVVQFGGCSDEGVTKGQWLDPK